MDMHARGTTAVTRHIFVMGLDERHRRYVESIRHPEEYTFHGLLDFEELIQPAEYPFDALLAKAGQTIREFPGEVAGIITHWDFPASTMLPLLARDFGYRAPAAEAVMACEHKYWSRLEQRVAIPEMTPGFCPVDPFVDDPLSQVTLDFPFWLKPVKAFGSHLGYCIDNAQTFNRAVAELRTNIRRIGDAFNAALAHVELPGEVGAVDGNWCIAEELMKGRQCGIEGYVLDGHFAIHGVFDGVKDSHDLSFTRWEYPSVWPESVQRRMQAAAESFLAHVGYDNAPFGMEFFWDEAHDKLMVLEVNTRISQSHSDQFVKVEGVSNHEVAVDVALGRLPRLFPEAGKYRTAAKFMLRRYHDATVIRVPAAAEIREIEAAFADSLVQPTVREGTCLGDLRDQDSYSYEIAYVWLGARDQEQLLARYRDVAGRLRFEFSDGGKLEPFQFETVHY